MNEKPRFLPSARTLPYEVCLMLAVGVFFTATGLFQSDQAPLPARTVYWCSVMVLGGAVIAGTEGIWHRYAPTGWRSAPISFAPVSILAAFPQTGVVLGAEAVLFRVEGTLFDLVDLWIAVWIVVFAMTALLRLLRLQLQALSSASSDTETDGDAAAIAMPGPLAARLDPPLRTARLLALQAEDHYVRVFTSAGEQLVLMRFGDAIDAVASLDGFRLHRSWWASRSAIIAAQFKSGTGKVELVGGVTAPVSRTYVAALRAEGLC